MSSLLPKIKGSYVFWPFTLKELHLNLNLNLNYGASILNKKHYFYRNYNEPDLGSVANL